MIDWRNGPQSQSPDYIKTTLHGLVTKSGLRISSLLIEHIVFAVKQSKLITKRYIRQKNLMSNEEQQKTL